MINEAELEHESNDEEELLLDARTDSFKLDPGHSSEKSHTKQINDSITHLKFSGDLQTDLINLMSQKPDQFQFSFTGLRRYLGGVHQQQLVNTIDRLIDDSILQKTQDGYFLSSEIRKANKKLNGDNWAESETWTGEKIYPKPIAVQKVYKELYGKWFGKHRFLGGIYKNDSIVLDWVDIDNTGVKTRLKANSNDVEVKFKYVSAFERDKALNVFSETFISINNPIMFERSNSFLNN